MQLTKRIEKGSALTYQEGDDNLDYLNTRIYDVEIDNSNIGDQRVLVYNTVTEKLEYQEQSGGITGIQGSVFFAGNTGEATEDNANFFYDETLGFLGLGTNMPDSRLSVEGTGSANIAVFKRNSDSFQVMRVTEDLSVKIGSNSSFNGLLQVNGNGVPGGKGVFTFEEDSQSLRMNSFGFLS